MCTIEKDFDCRSDVVNSQKHCMHIQYLNSREADDADRGSLPMKTQNSEIQHGQENELGEIVDELEDFLEGIDLGLLDRIALARIVDRLRQQS